MNVPCTTMGCPNLGTVPGLYDDGDTSQRVTYCAECADQLGKTGDFLADGTQDFPYDCTHGSWSLNGSMWTCQVCGKTVRSGSGERLSLAVPTNAQLSDDAQFLDTHTVVRNWLERHSGSTPVTWIGHRGAWLDWAASNFLADPEIAQHLVPRCAADRKAGEVA